MHAQKNIRDKTAVSIFPDSCSYPIVNGYELRVDKKNLFSIFDTFVCFCQVQRQSAPSLWNRLKKYNPELDSLWEKYQFAGKGQRDTPTADIENMFIILAVYKGKETAEEFRLWAEEHFTKMKEKGLEYWKYESQNFPTRIRSNLEENNEIKFNTMDLFAQFADLLVNRRLIRTLANHGIIDQWQYDNCFLIVKKNILSNTNKNGNEIIVTGNFKISLLEYMAIIGSELKAIDIIEKEKVDNYYRCYDIFDSVSKKLKKSLDI